ncbi:succinate dehydrogenase [Rhodobacteraceae bacterium WD3A24]|nr:succinate dehydrogenase [Rhodobacteraceae bacterium WD3A24]
MTEARLFALQRLSAMVLGPLVLVHLGVILYATRTGLTADALLERTTSSVLWPVFYGLFVVMAAIHAPIGLRNVLREWTPLPDRLVDWAMAAFALILLVMGLRAVWAVTGGVS